MTNQKKKTGYNRLQDLPAVFTTNTLAGQLGKPTKIATTYISRWRSEGLVSSMGGRAGVHYNLAKYPDAETEYSLDAVNYIFPSAVIAGATAVHDAGYTTQIPAETDIFIPYRRSAPKLDGFSISMRSQKWFKMARHHIAIEGAVPTLTPEFCLADLWVSKDWLADPDDIEWDMIDAAYLKHCFKLFDTDIPDLWMEEFSDIYEGPDDPEDDDTDYDI